MSTGFERFGADEPGQQNPSQPRAGSPGAAASGAAGPNSGQSAKVPPGRQRDNQGRRSSPTADTETPESAESPAAGAGRARSQPDTGRPGGASGARSHADNRRSDRTRPARNWARTRRSDPGSRESGDRGKRSGSDHRDHQGEAKPNGVSYPIVAQHVLDDAVRRGKVPIRKSREGTEIPKIKPHEVLVWRTGDRFIVDPRELQAHDHTVVHASSVSVVSVRPGTEVPVEFRIDTQDAAEFVVRVTFSCSVVDPVTVVRNGQVNAADALLEYLHAYPDLSQLGLKYSVIDVNKVRTAMAAHIKAYMAHYPPKIPGMEIGTATVHVETPATLGKIQEINEEQLIQLAKQAAEAAVAAQIENDNLASTQKISDAIRDDPRDAVIYAYKDGSITSQEAAQQLQQQYEADQQRDQVVEMAEKNREYAKEDRDAQWEHEEKVWERQRAERRDKEDREDRRDQIKANLELLKIYAERGYLDTANTDIDNLNSRIQGDVPGAPRAPEVSGEDRLELSEGQPDDPEDGNGD